MNKNNFRFLTTILMLCVMTLLTAFLLTIFKVIDLSIINNAVFPKWIEYIGKSFLFLIQTFFMIAITTKLSIRKSILFAIIFEPIHLLFSYINLNLITNSIIPTLYIAILFIVSKLKRTKKQWIYDCLWFVAFNIILVAVTYLLGFIKINNFGINYNETNFLVGFILNIDLYLFLIISLFITKEVRNYAVKQLVVLSESESVSEANKTSEESLDLSELNKRQKLIFWCMAMGYQFMQLGAVIAIGFINNTIIELIAMLITFWIGRKILGKCWHSNKLSICTLFTIVSFYVLTKITLPFSISLFTSIVLSASFTYGLYILGIRQEKVEALEEENTRLKQEPNIYAMSESELRAYCQSKKLNELETDIVCYMVLPPRLKDVEIYTKIGYSKSQYFRIKKKIKLVINL